MKTTPILSIARATRPSIRDESQVETQTRNLATESISRKEPREANAK